MRKSLLRDNRVTYLVNPKTEEITVCTLVKFPPYPYGYGFLTIGSSNLHVVTEEILINMYPTREEANQNIFNLFTVMNSR